MNPLALGLRVATVAVEVVRDRHCLARWAALELLACEQRALIAQQDRLVQAWKRRALDAEARAEARSAS